MSEYVFWEDSDGLYKREEIVRCRDCKHFKAETSRSPTLCRLWLPRNLSKQYGIEPDGFCSWGEFTELLPMLREGGEAMTELLPCPFCGGEARHYAPGPPDNHIECRNCCADMGGYMTEAEAIEAWNTRAERTCKLHKLSALGQTLSMADLCTWGVCSECGCLTPEDSRHCIGCGAKVVER